MEPRHSPIRLNLFSEEDRISNLPESVLHHILNFLDLKQVVRTSVLCTRWRFVWASLPSLYFNANSFKFHKIGHAKAFKRFVDQVLFLRDNSSKIQSFGLDCSCLVTYDDDISNGIYTWILNALRRNLQELYLNVPLLVGGFRLPLDLFTSKSLTKLELKISVHCTFEHKFTLPNSMSLPRLKTLLLHRVSIEGDDIPNKIFSKCPVLESLTMTKCKFRHQNLVFTAPNLKHLVIENLNYQGVDKKGYSIKLHAPNLISLICKDYLSNAYYIEDLSSLVKAEIDVFYKHPDNNEVLKLDDETRKTCEQWMMKVLGAIRKVEALTLSASFVQVVSGVPASSLTYNRFWNLKYLKLGAWLTRECTLVVLSLLEIFPNIESLYMEIKKDFDNRHQMYLDGLEYSFREKLESYWKREGLSRFMLYHLKFVEIRGVKGGIHEVHILAFLLKHAMVLEKMFLFKSKENLPNEDIKDKRLLKFTEKLLLLPKVSSSVAFLFF